MTIEQRWKQHFPLIMMLGAIALIRPIIKMTGIIHFLGKESFGSILLTILISLVWLIIVVKQRVQDPILILVSAGICYAILATLLSGIFSPIIDGTLQGPLTNPFALIGIFATNIIWGLLIGVIALPIRRLLIKN